ncbi:aconitase X [Tropicimonas sediminicola]|uniref:Predicted aconitase subunit 1 n=1 Tax=Tropicimonas sediminicola TaxID=1031541 RepID=A0A239HU96_9RHOB|nr:aconitase family protein [Tropicimonas sediminicola]SNS84967.1 predicted aconitase subunit 1 [Tropicimonas sediminicola]
MATVLVAASVSGPILVCDEGLSFWGGVHPETGVIIDQMHPQCGQSLAGKTVLMPTSRGSCTGSGVLLGLAFAGNAPKALVFREAEDILTLGAVIAGKLFDHGIAVLRLSAEEYDALAQQEAATITARDLVAGPLSLPLSQAARAPLELADSDRAFLEGAHGKAAQTAMEIITTMAIAIGATRLIDVTRVHIDGCIYASPAFLTFARAMADLGGRVRVPTTMNAISVDHANWRTQGVAEAFGLPASQLANAYVEMGARPSFTCAPYLLEDRPGEDEAIAWAESNAVIYANSVLGARTVKHADFMDLCAALTGRAAMSGVYLDENRAPRRILNVEAPAQPDDAFWPMLGWLAGQAAPDRIPLITGLEGTHPSDDDLKALCAAFGTTSAAPMLHVAGITPEASRPPSPDADEVRIPAADFARLWDRFNKGAEAVDLVALGSPHFSAAECAVFAGLMEGARVHDAVTAIITLGRDTLAAIKANGVKARLEAAGVRIIPDLCWCSISEPVFPPDARVLMTNSGKYAHYAPALSERAVRFGSLAQCAETARTGRASTTPPAWLKADRVVA